MLPRLEAWEKIRDLIAKVVVTPIEDGKNWEITVHGAVAEIIALTGNEIPERLPFQSVSPTVVAEVRDDRCSDMPELSATFPLYPPKAA